MNINTTINLDDLLNSNEENSSEEVVEILKESITETAKSIEENAPLPDFDAIVTEWSYRCDKGYPDMKNKSDMIKLQEILNEIGIKSPFKQIQLTELDKPKKKPVVKKAVKPESKTESWTDLKTGTKNEKVFKAKLVNGKLNFENNSIYQNIFDIFKTLEKGVQVKIIEEFQSMTVDQFENSGWKTFEPFFDARGYDGTKPGRGEMMAVLAIKGASSGGSKEKDLKLPNGTWEIKEAPNSIRMAKSGGIGYFGYVDETKAFYKLLKNIQLDNKKRDRILKTNLSKVFTNQETIEDVYRILTINFRGDGFKISAKEKAAAIEAGEELEEREDFFARLKTSEWPSGVIDLHYNGFRALKEIRNDVIENKDLINNAKLILRTAKQDDQEFYINPEDSDEIAAAMPGKEISIKVATPAKGDIVEFLQNMLLIIRHPFVVTPDAIIKDISDVKNSYFTGLEGILYYNKKGKTDLDPTPHLGRPKDWVIYGISQGAGKMALRAKKADSSSEWIKKQK